MRLVKDCIASAIRRTQNLTISPPPPHRGSNEEPHTGDIFFKSRQDREGIR